MTPYIGASDVTFTDFFCGFGGSSIGLTEAGLRLLWAANHWDRAIETHGDNFPDAEHFQGDISGYDMRRVPNARVAWISPECTWHSPAGGRKRLRAQMDTLYPDDHVPDAAGERSRATMWDVVRAAEAKQFEVVIVENVVEVTTWPLFENWLGAMESLDYEFQILCVTAAHIGGESNPHAPQWRDRIYVIFYKRGIPFPDVAPRPLAWCSQCEDVVESVQSWKRSDQKRRVGKYGPQYVYVCTSMSHAPQIVEPYVLPAAAAIDWSDLGTRIADRKPREFFADKARTQSLGWHHLAPATLRRVGVGYRMFGRPVVAAHTGQTWDSAKTGQGDYFRVQAADGAPLLTRQAGGSGDALAVPPFLVNMRHGKSDHGRQALPGDGPLPAAQTKIGDGLVLPFIDVARTHNPPRGTDEPLAPLTTAQNQGLVSPPLIVAGYDHKGGDARRVRSAEDAPLGTIVANGRGHHQLVTPPFIAEQWGTSTARGINEPLATVTAGGGHHGLTIPDGAFLSRAYGSRGGEGEHLNTTVMEPTHPITASGGGNHALVIPPSRGSRPPMLDIPDAELQEAVLNSLFRPLGPREHLRAQRFPDTYQVRGNKGEQTQGAGNAVASNVAHYIGVLVMRALGTPLERVLGRAA